MVIIKSYSDEFHFYEPKIEKFELYPSFVTLRVLK